MGSAGAAQAAGGIDRLAAAHQRLLADKSLQFDFDAIPRDPPPTWLLSLGELIQALFPVLKLLFWAGLALAVGFILFFIAREILGLRLPGMKRKAKPERPEAIDWRPAAPKARALLQDADRLAAQGLFAEAAHLLLFRSIADIEGRRPDLVKPALTSRDIAELKELPSSARPTFAVIARAVERSLFGGRPLDAEGFAECRRAYESFAFPGTWA